MPTRDEADQRERFGERYARGQAATLELEQRVLGTDYGANGFTTLAQADALVDLLDLAPGRRLLDLGSGCGWPGVYLAGRSGCDVVVTDLTVEGIRRAATRAAADGFGDRCLAVVASARHLPLRPETFDAIVHTDVLC